MKNPTKLSLAFIAFAGAVASSAYAADQTPSSKMHDGAMMRLQKELNGSNGGVTLDQFSDAMHARLKDMIAKNGGKLTVEELADALEKARFERIAKRMISRFDVNGDGVLTADEVAGREKKIFALLDKNDDGKIERSELPRGAWGHGGRHMKDGDTAPGAASSGNGSDDGSK